MAEVIASGVALPSPTQIKMSDEIIWSSNTGRVASGTMVGDVIAEKVTVTITWEMLTEAEVASIRSSMPAGFFSITVLGISFVAYRGNLQSDVLGIINGTVYYKSVTVTAIQK
ncbi:MAG: hypothetical protein ACI4F9_00935 [Lachnospiraceae bacterium]